MYKTFKKVAAVAVLLVISGGIWFNINDLFLK